jgi:hypothetical protein
MSAADNKPALPVAALAKGFATASMFFNFVGMPLTSIPEAASAKSGDGPKQSVFGLGGDAASSPFVADAPTYSPYCEFGALVGFDGRRKALRRAYRTTL